jgi:hypothetical protein
MIQTQVLFKEIYPRDKIKKNNQFLFIGWEIGFNKNEKSLEK